MDRNIGGNWGYLFTSASSQLRAARPPEAGEFFDILKFRSQMEFLTIFAKFLVTLCTYPKVLRGGRDCSGLGCFLRIGRTGLDKSLNPMVCSVNV